MDISIKVAGSDMHVELAGAMSFRDKDAFTKVVDVLKTPQCQSLAIDLSALTHIDSFGIGLFLLAHEQAVASGKRVHLCNPRGDVARVFELANLDAVLSLEQPVLSRVAARVAPGVSRRPGFSCGRGADADDGSPCIHCCGRLVFAEHANFEEVVHSLIDTGGPRVVLDLSELEFMDSAGLSMIMIAREEAEAKGITLVLRDPRGAVAQLLSLSALEFMLEG